jgi:hypothetical protein
LDTAIESIYIPPLNPARFRSYTNEEYDEFLETRSVSEYSVGSDSASASTATCTTPSTARTSDSIGDIKADLKKALSQSTGHSRDSSLLSNTSIHFVTPPGTFPELTTCARKGCKTRFTPWHPAYSKLYGLPKDTPEEFGNDNENDPSSPAGDAVQKNKRASVLSASAASAHSSHQHHRRTSSVISHPDLPLDFHKPSKDTVQPVTCLCPHHAALTSIGNQIIELSLHLPLHVRDLLVTYHVSLAKSYDLFKRKDAGDEKARNELRKLVQAKVAPKLREWLKRLERDWFDEPARRGIEGAGIETWEWVDVERPGEAKKTTAKTDKEEERGDEVRELNISKEVGGIPGGRRRMSSRFSVKRMSSHFKVVVG